MDRKDILKERMELLKIKRGVDDISPFDPELGFVTNSEEIRQIALRSLKRQISEEDPYGEENWDDELDTIHPYLDFNALYPEIISYSNEYKSKIDPKITARFDQIMSDIYEKRKDFKKLMNE